MTCVGGYSIFYAVESTQARLAGGFFLLLGLITVSVIRTCRAQEGNED